MEGPADTGESLQGHHHHTVDTPWVVKTQPDFGTLLKSLKQYNTPVHSEGSC